MVKNRNFDFTWHSDEECQLEFNYKDDKGRHFFCHTHNQWVTDKPVSIQVIRMYADGGIELETKI